jgi:hypothetical protein
MALEEMADTAAVMAGGMTRPTVNLKPGSRTTDPPPN